MDPQSKFQPQQIMAPFVTTGVVVDTNDPTQMGRLRIFCPAFNDADVEEVERIPWARYVSPFGGEVQVGTRGPGDNGDLKGPTSYGMWGIPKVGAEVLVMCLEGRTDRRVWVGCLYGQFLPHTMPHGRYSSDPDFAGDGNSPAGPFDSYERSIEPLASNIEEAFPNPGGTNFEYQTRAADYQVSSVNDRQLQNTHSSLPDDDGSGYGLSRIDPELEVNQNYTDANNDNMVTSIVSPGFHAMSMDDRIENGRMRFRTAAGHQVILDDTNERIYISTAKGKNWIEIDQAGNIDIYTEGKMSVNAEKDINFSTKGSFRVNAERGIHLKSGKEVRVNSAEDISINSDFNIRAKAKQNILLETSQTDISLKAAQQVTIQTTNGDISLKSNANILGSSESLTSFSAGTGFVVGANTIDLGASAAVTVTGSRIDLNGPQAQSPTDPKNATPANPALSFYPNRQPQHEPWARIGNKDTTGEPLFGYDAQQIGKQDVVTGADGTSSETITFTRGDFWRR